MLRVFSTSIILLLFATGAFTQQAKTANSAKAAGDNANAPSSTASPRPISSTPPSQRIIGPEDSITIVALDSDELSKTWRVNSEGDIVLPMVGKVHVAGKSTEQLENELTENLKRYIRQPQITVYIEDLRSQSVTVSGAVDKPGIYPLDGPKPLIMVLTMAGGARGSAMVTVSRDLNNGIIPIATAHSDPEGKHTTVDFDLKTVLSPASTAANLEIRSGDVITVIPTEQRLVYIIGDVNRPGSVELVTHPTVSLMQVLAVAGGLGPGAAPGGTKIMHINSQGLYGNSVTVDLKKVMLGKVEDRLLVPGDIVVVPSSKLKNYSEATAMAAITTGMLILTRY